ncbi:MAG: heavy metal translocating P-type ATPase [Rubrivivax sp.]|nr:heavy metal translocating P-type ATPase [Rubrivivax sp.]
MDCASEESEIRRAVDSIDGIRTLTFQLGQRTLAIDAPQAAVALAVVAIRKAGFDPQPLPDPGASSTHAASQAADDHQHGARSAAAWRLGWALLLAVGAELLGFFAPNTPMWKGAWAVFGNASMWMAIFADMGASLLVVGNGLCLLKVRLQC